MFMPRFTCAQPRLSADARAAVVSAAGPNVITQTLYAKITCASNIIEPATARATQYGAAASTEAMNGSPSAHVSPCIVPATESTRT